MNCPNCKSEINANSNKCEYCDSEVKQQKPNYKAFFDKINQESIDKNVATKEQFWDTFHHMLNAPYSFWREHNSTTLQEWVDICWNSPHIKKSIENLSQFPILKGEGLVTCLTGGDQLLTNYRYIYSSSGQLINIPLHNLLHYDVVIEGNDIISTKNLLIKYLKNDIEHSLRLTYWLKDEDMTAVRNAQEWKKLNDIQKKILDLSHYELSNYDILVPKIGMLEKSPAKGCFG